MEMSEQPTTPSDQTSGPPIQTRIRSLLETKKRRVIVASVALLVLVVAAIAIAITSKRKVLTGKLE